IFDVFHKKGGEFLHCAPTRGRNTLGEDTLSVADEIERRFNSMLAISLHESLEIYLKTIYGKVLYLMRNDQRIADKAYHKAHPRMAKHAGTLPYFLHYAQFACRRDCSQSLRKLKKELDWGKIKINLNWKMSFDELVQVLGLCRNGI